MISLHISPVPTGTVDLFTKTLYAVICSPTVLATAFTYFRSALWFSSGGVQTAEKMTVAKLTHLHAFVENSSLHSFVFLFTNSSRPGSYMGMIPCLKLSIFCLSTSIHITSCPISARQVQVTNHTYPVPNIVTFMFLRRN